MEESLDYAQQDPLTPKEEGLVYAQQDPLTLRRRAWSMRLRVPLSHGSQVYMRLRVLSPMVLGCIIPTRVPLSHGPERYNTHQGASPMVLRGVYTHQGASHGPERKRETVRERENVRERGKAGMSRMSRIVENVLKPPVNPYGDRHS